MTTITFDTLELVDKLKTAGISAEQAESIVRVIAEAQNELATKQDLKELSQALEVRFERIDGQFALLKWMMGILIAGVMSIVIKTFF